MEHKLGGAKTGEVVCAAATEPYTPNCTTPNLPAVQLIHTIHIICTYLRYLPAVQLIRTTPHTRTYLRYSSSILQRISSVPHRSLPAVQLLQVSCQRLPLAVQVRRHLCKHGRCRHAILVRVHATQHEANGLLVRKQDAQATLHRLYTYMGLVMGMIGG